MGGEAGGKGSQCPSSCTSPTPRRAHCPDTGVSPLAGGFLLTSRPSLAGMGMQSEGGKPVAVDKKGNHVCDQEFWRRSIGAEFWKA